VGILSRLDQTGLVRETGDVSTYLGGHEASLQRYLIDLAADLAETGHHCTLSVTLSRGCPGEAVCDLPGGAGPRRTDVPARAAPVGTPPANGRCTRSPTRSRPTAPHPTTCATSTPRSRTPGSGGRSADPSTSSPVSRAMSARSSPRPW